MRKSRKALLVLLGVAACAAAAALAAEPEDAAEQEALYQSLCHPLRSRGDEDDAALNVFFIAFLDDPGPTIERLLKGGVLVKASRDDDEELQEDWESSCGYLARFSRDIGVRGCFDATGINHYAVRATAACQPLWTRIDAQGGL